MGIGRGVSEVVGNSMNWTSGGSVIISRRTKGNNWGRERTSGGRTDWVFVIESKLQSVGMALVEWVVI